MIHHVTEFPASAPEQIDHFAKLLARSPQARRVFKEIYRGQSKKPKTAAEIGRKVGLTPKRVLEIGKVLAAHQLFEQTKQNGLTAYKKHHNLNAVKKDILRLAGDRAKLAAHVTTRKPLILPKTFQMRMVKSGRDMFVDVRFITVDDIDNFSAVRGLKHNNIPAHIVPARLPEKVFKQGVAKLLGNRGSFKDWGGEKHDLYTTHLKIKGKRYATSIGLKGPATSGILTPGKMGKNGDQIQRLFDTDAQVFLVQYEGQISPSVPEQMKRLAVAKSAEDSRTVFYGIVSLEDSYRLRLKYKNCF